MSTVRSVVVALAVGLGLCLGASMLSSAGLRTPLDTLDDWAHDGWLRTRNAAAPVPGFRAFYPQVVLIDVDDDSLRRLGRWPWPRTRFVELLRVLRTAGARVVAWDLLFAEPASGDAALARALDASPPTNVLGTLYRRTSEDGLEVDRPLEWLGSTRPWKARIAMVGVTPDADGVLRRVPLAIPTDHGPLPALSLQAWCAAHGLKTLAVGPSSIRTGPLDLPARSGTVRIDWPTPDLARFDTRQGFRELFPLCEVVPFADALTLPPELARRVFGGRIVLVGGMAQAFKEDVVSTPVGMMPGLLVHACLLIDILENRMLIEHPPWQPFIGLMVSALIIGWAAGRRLHPLGLLILAVGLYAAWWGLARWLFMSSGGIMGVAAPALNAVVLLVLLAWQNAREARDKAEVRRIFGQYLSPSVVDTLVAARRAGRLGLGGKREKVTVLFADVRNFTSMAEAMTPEDVVRMLNELFDALVEVAVTHGAYVDKFGGDSIMVVFSAPIPRPDDALRAVQAARAMQARVAALNARWEAEGRCRMQIGIGIDTGEALLGSIGSALKREYTVIGDHVNVAARLCSAAAGGQILISGDTWGEVRDHLSTQPLPPMRLKGKREPLTVHDASPPLQPSREEVTPPSPPATTRAWMSAAAHGVPPQRSHVREAASSPQPAPVDLIHLEKEAQE